MRGQEEHIAETLLAPHSVILSHYDPAVHLYHKLFDETPVTRKYLEEDGFVITSFFTSREKKGVCIWHQ